MAQNQMALFKPRPHGGAVYMYSMQAKTHITIYVHSLQPETTWPLVIAALGVAGPVGLSPPRDHRARASGSIGDQIDVPPAAR